MLKKKVNLIVSLILGMGLFIGVIRYFGLDSIKLIYQNMNPIYLGLYLLFGILVIFANSLRLQVILKAHKKKVPLLSLAKQNIAGFSMSYITPSVKLGGEPLKAYMLKKENNIDLKTGSSAMILDKFIEILGTIFIGVIGLIILFLIPGIPFSARAILISIILIGTLLLFWIYSRTIRKKGSFSTLFVILKFYKVTKWKSLLKIIEKVEYKMHRFFIFNKKEFFYSFLFFLLYFILNIIEFKFLFLSFGVNASLTEIILTIVVLGIVNFIPIPGALGFLEAGQSALYSMLKSSASIGLAFSLIIRLRNLLMVVIGFTIISHFSGKQIIKEPK